MTAAALTAATAMLVGAAGLVAGGSGQARAAGGAVVLDEGEMDFTPRLVDGKVELRIDDRSGAATAVREPSEVVLHAVQSSLHFTPSPLSSALGTTDLDTWQLNHWDAANIFAPEPGWNGSAAGGDTEVELSAYEGPGDFGLATYTRAMDNVDAAPIVHLGSVEPTPRSFTLSGDEQRLVPTWQFTKEGVYRLTFTVTGGGSTDTETLAVVVGDDVDPSEVLPGDGSTPTPTTSAPGPPSGSATPTSPPPTAHVIDNGHLDLAARPVDDALQFQIKEGNSQTYEWYEPGEVVLHVKPAARRKITEGYEFLGTVGDPVWWLPMQQIDGLVWPGWSTEEYAGSDIDGDITYRLDAVRGPGSVAVFNAGSLGSADVALNSGDGLPDRLAHSVNSHSHWNWTFTAEGVYRTAFTVSATLADGTKVTDTGTIAWVVGDDTDPSTVTPGAGDEPTATPTATASASDTPSTPATPSASATPSAPATATATDTGPVSNSTDTVGGSSADDTVTTGGLASTGAGVAVIAVIATVALLVGVGAVFAVRRRRTAQ
ncbi:choice-of-anchor M domain-containing protein [Streptomyces sp. NPDC058391]|uniref:choice-of-anchor M domain-containing protein n=1 Tax=Streptomyces sp. NPDC058391 TaxID=3346476 RepID=UPI0036690621